MLFRSSQAESYKEENFVKSGWANLVTAMANAKKVLDNPSANQSTVDIVTVKLEDAMQNLDRVDKVQVGTPEDNVLLTYNASETKDNAGFEKTESDWGNWPSDVNREITEEQKIPREYGVDFDTGQLTGEIVEGLEAIKVWIWLVLQTPRYRYYIYTWDHGNEFEDLIGKGYTEEYMNTEIYRMTEECLLMNEDIQSISDFCV